MGSFGQFWNFVLWHKGLEVRRAPFSEKKPILWKCWDMQSLGTQRGHPIACLRRLSTSWSHVESCSLPLRLLNPVIKSGLSIGCWSWQASGIESFWPHTRKVFSSTQRLLKSGVIVRDLVSQVLKDQRWKGQVRSHLTTKVLFVRIPAVSPVAEWLCACCLEANGRTGRCSDRKIVLCKH